MQLIEAHVVNRLINAQPMKLRQFNTLKNHTTHIEPRGNVRSHQIEIYYFPL